MEALWTIPIYIISPLIGLIFICIGIFKIRKGKSKKTIYVGLTFLALPFMYLLLMSVFQFGLEKEIKGKYNIGNEREILTIENNGKFNLKNSYSYRNSGNGTWKIEEIDSPILILNFNSPKKSELWLEIKKDEKFITLTSMSWGNNIKIEFNKEKHSH